MALQKEIQMKDGVTVRYWRIIGFQFFDYEAKTVNVWVKGWVSKAARDAGAESVANATKTITIPASRFMSFFRDADMSAEGKSPLANAYQCLKAIAANRGPQDPELDEFQGAADV